MRTAALRLTIRSELSELARVRPGVQAWLDEWNASERLRYDVDLVLEEIVTNLIKHGCRGRTPKDITLALAVEGDFVTMRITDRGRRFDPRKVGPPDLSDRIEDRQPAGLGIHLVRQVAELVDYRRDGECNVLDLRVFEPLSPSES